MHFVCIGYKINSLPFVHAMFSSVFTRKLLNASYFGIRLMHLLCTGNRIVISVKTWVNTCLVMDRAICFHYFIWVIKCFFYWDFDPKISVVEKDWSASQCEFRGVKSSYKQKCCIVWNSWRLIQSEKFNFEASSRHDKSTFFKHISRYD